MSRREYIQKPLVYIEQPTIGHPEAEMQDSYQTDRNQTEFHKTVENEQGQRKIHPFNQIFMNEYEEYGEYEESDEHIELDQQLNADDSSTEKANPKENDKFADLSIDDKIDYLMNRPQFIPTLTCQIQTTEGNHYGKIINFKEDVVTLRSARSRAIKRIDRDSIEDIRLVGF